MNASSIVREARLRAGLSQRALADRLGTKQSVVARWETGATSPTLAAVAAVCDASGFTSEWRLAPIDPDTDRVILEQLRRTPAARVRSVAGVAALARASRAHA